MPPGRTRSAAERSSASCSSGSGVARQRRSGRCGEDAEAGARRVDERAVEAVELRRQRGPVRLDDRDVGAAHRREVLAQLARAVPDRSRPPSPRRAAARSCRPGAAQRSRTRSPSLRADAEAGELRAAALRPDPPARRPAPRPRARRGTRRGRRSPPLRPEVAAHEPDDRLERLVHRAHQRERAVLPEHAHEVLVDPVGIRLLQRPVGQRLEQRPDPVGRAAASPRS